MYRGTIALYLELPLKSIWKHQLVQNVASWVNGTSYLTHVAPLLCDALTAVVLPGAIQGTIYHF